MKVSGLGHFSVGQPVPNRDHAVCVSLPKVSDLVGYEEKKPETIDLMKSDTPDSLEIIESNPLLIITN